MHIPLPGNLISIILETNGTGRETKFSYREVVLRVHPPFMLIVINISCTLYAEAGTVQSPTKKFLN